MRPIVRWEAGRPNENRPHADQVYADVKNHVDQVVAGYLSI